MKLILRVGAIVCAWVFISASPGLALTWSAPIHVDTGTPAGHQPYLTSLSCLSASWCIGPDSRGRVASSTDPAGGPGAWSARSVTSNPMYQIACPSTSECVGIDLYGAVSSSVDPATGAWSTANVDFGHRVTSIACPTRDLCIAGDDYGDILTSSNPLGGAGDWSQPTRTGSDAFIGSLACPSVTLCVGGGSDAILYSSDPFDRNPAWHVIDQHGDTVRGLACPSVQLCVAVSNGGRVLTSTDPASGAWTAGPLGSVPWGVACPSVELCVSVDVDGSIYVTSDPAGGASTWSGPISVDPGGHLVAITCPDSKFCALTDTSGRVITSTDPLGGSGSWSRSVAEVGANAISALACPTAQRCVALDEAGRVLGSGDPSTPSSWTFAGVTALNGEYPLSLSCPSVALCIGMGQNNPNPQGNPQGAPGSSFGRFNTFVTSSNPTDGNSWQGFTAPHGSPSNARALSCPTAAFCAALEDSGIAFTASPTSSSTAWSSSGSINTGSYLGLASLACASTRLCLVTDYDGGVGVSTDPAASPSHWRTFRVDTAAPLSGLVGGHVPLYDSACTDYPFCIATDDGGNVVSSVDPAAGPGSWHTVNLGLGYSLDQIACPDIRLCVAIAPAGRVVSSYAPWDGPAGWHADQVDPTSQLTAITCPSLALCIAGDDDGNILIGSGPATSPYALPPPGHSTTEPTNPAGPTSPTGQPGITPAAAHAALTTALNHSCQREPIRRILTARGCRTPFVAPGRGRLTITWTASGNRFLARARDVAVTPGLRFVLVKLTPEGAILLRNVRRALKAQVNATLTDATHHDYTLSKRIELRVG